jgi:hypothetical protein
LPILLLLVIPQFIVMFKEKRDHFHVLLPVSIYWSAVIRILYFIICGVIAYEFAHIIDFIFLKEDMEQRVNLFMQEFNLFIIGTYFILVPSLLLFSDIYNIFLENHWRKSIVFMILALLVFFCLFIYCNGYKVLNILFQTNLLFGYKTAFFLLCLLISGITIISFVRRGSHLG